jgi:hypothetical protein
VVYVFMGKNESSLKLENVCRKLLDSKWVKEAQFYNWNLIIEWVILYCFIFVLNLIKMKSVIELVKTAQGYSIVEEGHEINKVSGRISR